MKIFLDKIFFYFIISTLETRVLIVRLRSLLAPSEVERVKINKILKEV